jgi:hypothetical protein
MYITYMIARELRKEIVERYERQTAAHSRGQLRPGFKRLLAAICAGTKRPAVIGRPIVVFNSRNFELAAIT